MELTHDFTVPADVQTTWATFMDLESVGNCFPGATVTSVTDDDFSGTVKVKLGPIAMLYAGSGTFLERDDASHRAVIEAKGKDKRGNGTAGATVTIQLAPFSEGTRVDVATDLSVTGKPASASSLAVPPVDKSCTPSMCSSLANAITPVLSETERSAFIGWGRSWKLKNLKEIRPQRL